MLLPGIHPHQVVVMNVRSVMMGWMYAVYCHECRLALHLEEYLDEDGKALRLVTPEEIR